MDCVVVVVKAQVVLLVAVEVRAVEVRSFVRAVEVRWFVRNNEALEVRRSRNNEAVEAVEVQN